MCPVAMTNSKNLFKYRHYASLHNNVGEQESQEEKDDHCENDPDRGSDRDQLLVFDLLILTLMVAQVVSEKHDRE